MCYRPQRGEPRSRQEADELFGTRATEESRIFKATFTVLLFFFNLLHWGMFVSFSQVRIKNMFFLAMPTKAQSLKITEKSSHFVPNFLRLFLLIFNYCAKPWFFVLIHSSFSDLAAIQDFGFHSYIFTTRIRWRFHRHSLFGHFDCRTFASCCGHFYLSLHHFRW